jgi:hypothetical protein
MINGYVFNKSHVVNDKMLYIDKDKVRKKFMKLSTIINSVLIKNNDINYVIDFKNKWSITS